MRSISIPVPDEDKLFVQWRSLVDYFLHGLVEKYGNLVNLDEAESDLSFALLKAIRTYDPTHDSASSQMTYYCRVMYNEITKNTSQVLMTDTTYSKNAVDESNDPPNPPHIDEAVVDLAFAVLGPNQRRVILERVMGGKTLAVVANLMHISVEGVRLIEGQAIAAMRGILKSRGISDIYDARFADGSEGEFDWKESPLERVL